MSKWIKYIIIIFFGSTLYAQTWHEYIRWEDKGYFVHSEQKTVPTHADAVHDPETNYLPYFVKLYPTQSNQINQVTLTNKVYESIVEDSDFLQNISSEAAVDYTVVYQQKQPYVQVSILPVRRNAYTGQFEQLVAFDVEIEESAATFSPNPLYRNFASESELRTGIWHKIAIPADDVYIITHDFLKDEVGINPQQISFSTFGIFGNGNGILPEENADSRVDDLEEIPIKIVDHNANNAFDVNDYILFYGKGPDLWHYDFSDNRARHQKNIYSDVACYFISPDRGTGKDFFTEMSQSVGSPLYTTFHDWRFFEEESNNLLKSGRRWFGEVQSSLAPTKTFSFSFPNRVVSEPVQITSVVLGNSALAQSSFSVFANNSQLTTQYIAIIPGVSYPPGANEHTYESTFLSSTADISCTYTYNTNDPQARGYIDYVELTAIRQLTMHGNRMAFRNPETVSAGQISAFRIQNTHSSIEVWDVTKPTEITKILPGISASQTEFAVPTNHLREFVAVDVSSTNFSTPAYVKQVDNQNLHSLGSRDMIIVTVPALKSAADDLADMHRNQDGLSVEVVFVEQIYNEFSSGQQDATAIRDFVKMFYDRASTTEELPKYLLLFGDASYDYKDRIAINDNLIPTYESPESLNTLSTFASDDFYGFLDDTEGGDIDNAANPDILDIAVGRIPVSTLSEAQGVVDKIKGYSTSYGPWRNELTFVADDEDSNLHFDQSDQLANNTFNQIERFDHYNIDKIYIDAYNQVNASAGDRYPSALEAILRKLYTGTFVMNYTGHGGPKNWAQERIFNIDDIQELDNIHALPLFITATCDFSVFDNPGEHSAGESLITNREGGAIALVTTVRLVDAGNNFTINRAVLNNLFETYDNRMPTVGEVMMQAKNQITGNFNNRKFVLLGDPALQLAYPTDSVITTEVNGNPVSQVDTLNALSKVTISGNVLDRNGLVNTSFNGVVYPTVFDKTSTLQTRANDSGSEVEEFELRRNALFKGKASVTDGAFSFEFIVPKDINYSFDNGKISYYAQDELNHRDAQGYTYDIIIGGTNEAASSDQKGPDVNAFMNDSTFVFGGITDENPILLLSLFDEHGINTVGNGLGHDITAVLDGNTQEKYVLNDFYEATIDDFRSGKVSFPFSNLEDGLHRVEIKAWDVYNNPGEGYTEFVVASSEEIAIRNVLNYPNPFTTHTSFIFEHNRPNDLLNITIEIYTISGRIVKTIRETVQSDSYRINKNEITWNGLDNYGDPIGRGVYIYKVYVGGTDGKSDHAFEKLVILR